jgi:drug/metabolite transporter (DMT)-like permease
VADIEDSRSAYSGYSLIFLAVVFFSTIEVGSQHLQRELGVSALDVSFLRFSIGGMFLIIAAWVKIGLRRFLEIIGADGLRLALLGLVGVTGVSLCFHRSLMLTSSMIGGAIFSINPAVVALIFVIFRAARLSLSRVVGIALGIACVFVTNIGAQAHEPEFPRYFLGNMFMVGSVLAWSFYFFLVRNYIRKYGGLVVSAIVVIGGSIGLLLFAPFSSSLGWGKSLSFFGALTLSGWILALYLGIVTVGLGYYWLYSGLAKTGVANGMMVFFIKPALVALLAHFLQDQPLSIWIWIGIILAAASILVVSIAGKRGG